MRTLGAQLTAAAAAADWERLQAAAQALPAALRALAGAGPLDAAERQALARLREAHRQAAAACARAAQALALRLDEMRDNKEGWIAYALTGEHDADKAPI